jgi:SAM-dependent methyltransferase
MRNESPGAGGASALRSILGSIVQQYPPELVQGQLTQVDRFAFDVGLVASRVKQGARVCDIGGGWGTFALGCAASGMRAVLVDDFRDRGFLDEERMASMQRLYARYGVEVVVRDVVSQPLDVPERSFDAITIFDALEHWHHSPRGLLRSVVRALKEGGLFVMATPNCVNLRKRITVPLGRGKWSAMSDWYEPDVFRGHVREPDVEDLRYIARDMGLVEVAILGRNWAGHGSPSGVVRRLTACFDRVLRLRPSLCSDLYLLGRAPVAPGSRAGR